MRNEPDPAMVEARKDVCRHCGRIKEVGPGEDGLYLSLCPTCWRLFDDDWLQISHECVSHWIRFTVSLVTSVFYLLKVKTVEGWLAEVVELLGAWTGWVIVGAAGLVYSLISFWFLISWNDTRDQFEAAASGPLRGLYLRFMGKRLVVSALMILGWVLVCSPSWSFGRFARAQTPVHLMLVLLLAFWTTRKVSFNDVAMPYIQDRD